MQRTNHLQLKVVSTSEEQLQAFAIRTLVYIGEQNCPWAEEFDCNDYAATQVLGLIDGEPVATARIRWFGSFAKLERLAVRAEYRGSGHGRQLLEFLIDLCRTKGFARVYLHAQILLEPFYRRYGFSQVGEPFSFSDYQYVEMAASVCPDRQVLTIQHGPHVLNRPEGSWDQIGILERSTARSPVSRVPFQSSANQPPAFVASYR